MSALRSICTDVSSGPVAIMRNSLWSVAIARAASRKTSGASRSVITTGCDADALPQSTWPESGAAACFDESSIFGRRPPPTPPRSAAAVRLERRSLPPPPLPPCFASASRAFAPKPLALPPWCCTAPNCFAPKPPALPLALPPTCLAPWCLPPPSPSGDLPWCLPPRR